MAADIAAARPAVADDSAAQVLAQPTPPAAFWAAFVENKGAVFGLAIFGVVLLLALTANVVSPYSPIEQFREAVRAPPVWDAGGSWRFVLGTDGDGHDMLSRLIYGSRVSLFIGFAVMSVSFVIGAVLGADGRSVCRAWETGIGKLIEFEDNVFDMRYFHIGPLALENLGLRV